MQGRRVKSIYVVPMLAALSAVPSCGGDDDGGGSGTPTGGSGGSAGTSGSTPRGAVAFRIGKPLESEQAPGAHCPLPIILDRIGMIDGNEAQTVVDGESGAHVACRVQMTGDQLTIQVSISQGATSFALAGAVSPGGVGQISSLQVRNNATVATYVADSSVGCQMWVMPSQGSARLGASLGHVWAGFRCPSLLDPQAPDVQCSMTESDPVVPAGYLLFDDCEQ
jgi:hypothetical protein